MTLPPDHPPPDPMPARWPRKPAVIASAAAGGLASLLIAVGTIAHLAGSKDLPAASPAATTCTGNSLAELDRCRTGTAAAPAPTTTKPTYAAPKSADFSLRVVVLSKKCFGSAGCNVSFRIELSHSGPGLDPSGSYRVLYTITGGEDGPQQNSLTVNGSSYSADSEEFIQTKSASVTLTATVTEVLEG